ncbi:uncharacterized protein TNCV_1008641 [Trichonephila clavipes]|nr:uncharacterized protein TNCV_1008641 [Trichonephila clavipes]
MSTVPKDKDVNNRKVVFNYPLLKESDMTEEMKTDTMDLCVTSYEKHSSDHEVGMMPNNLMNHKTQKLAEGIKISGMI